MWHLTFAATGDNRFRGDVYVVLEYAPFDLAGLFRKRVHLTIVSSHRRTRGSTFRTTFRTR